MQIEKPYKTLDITAFINDYHPSSQSYSMDEGVSRRMSMEGHIDDPGVGPLGDIYENEKNSGFSRAPITIKMALDSGGHFKEAIEELDETAIGIIFIRKNVEVKTFNLEGKEYIDHPITVWLALPSKLFSFVEETLKNNKKSGKLGMLQIKARATKDQIIQKNTDWASSSYLEVKDLDVSGDFLRLGVFEFVFTKTVLDIDQIQQKRVKTISSEGETTERNIALLQNSISFDTSRGIYKQINIEGETTKHPNHYESESIKVSVELEEFWEISEDPLLNYRELPEKSIYGRYSYSHDNNYLSLSLAYHPEDFDDQIKPLLLRSALIHVWLQVRFADMLNFDADQQGNIISFSINSQNVEEIILEENEQEVMEKLTNIDRKISDYVHSLEERLESVEKAIRSDSFQNMWEIEGIKKEMALPRDILSRIVLKIPIIGSILRFLAR